MNQPQNHFGERHPATEDVPPEVAANPAWQRRVARLERWNRPITTLWQRLRAWTNMVFVDHGIFRLIYSNTHRVGRHAWRSAQPAPHHLGRFARAGGLTVVNLRGGQTFGSLPLEREACIRYALDYRVFVLRSRGLPDRETLLGAIGFLDQIQYPALFHCKSGADRAGFMSALYLLAREDAPIETAQKQLDIRYGHFRSGPTGILDALFDAYAAEHAKDGIGFRDWVATRYDPDEIRKGFRVSNWASILVNRILRRE